MRVDGAARRVSAVPDAVRCPLGGCGKRPAYLLGRAGPQRAVCDRQLIDRKCRGVGEGQWREE